MHLQVNKKNKIFFYFILFVLFTTINNHNFYELKNKIFKINSIEIYGLKDKDKIQVIEKFSYLLARIKSLKRDGTLGKVKSMRTMIENSIALLANTAELKARGQAMAQILDIEH